MSSASETVAATSPTSRRPPAPQDFGLTRAQARGRDTPGGGVLPVFLMVGAAQGALLLPFVNDEPLVYGALAGLLIAVFLSPALWLALLPARIPIWRGRHRYREAQLRYWSRRFERDLLSRKGFAFEDRFAELLSRAGYRAVAVTERIGERLIDVTARRGRQRGAFQCMVRATEVGAHDVAALRTAVEEGPFRLGALVAPGGWSADAEQLAAGTRVQLWGRPELRALVSRAVRAGEVLSYPDLLEDDPLSVDTGLTEVARRAGNQEAASATSRKAAATTP